MKAMITCTTELIQGGCNACPVVPATTYAVTFEETPTPLEGLDVESLVMVVALKNGFRQELVMGMDDDYIVFKKAGQEINAKEQYGRLTYEGGGNSLTLQNRYLKNEDLFAKVNDVLTKVFQVPTVDFVVEEIEA